MVSIVEHYDTYPYPERDPEDEKTRLVQGSPSHPFEIDHFLFGGRRDWRQPLRALVAGGGSGDGLIQLAQILTTAGRPYEITYVDVSSSAREVAEARAGVRKLDGIRFVTGSLMDAPKLGSFDYIDCCGVLHHLPDPAAGFAALRQALAPGGGLGFMVYAPYGRSGVYPLQEAFETLFGALAPGEKLAAAKHLFASVPDGHPFRTNPHLVDHRDSDAGFFDLLLHSSDRAFDVAGLLATLKEGELDLVSFTEPAHYDLARLTQVPEGLDASACMALTEKLRGTMKVHVGYAVAAGGEQRVAATCRDMDQVPHFKGVTGPQLANEIARAGCVRLKPGGETVVEPVPRASAPLIAAVNGRRSLAELAALTKTDPIQFAALWGAIDAALVGWGLVLYSRLLR